MLLVDTYSGELHELLNKKSLLSASVGLSAGWVLSSPMLSRSH